LYKSVELAQFSFLENFVARLMNSKVIYMHSIYRDKATNEMGRQPLMVIGNKFKGGRVL